ncbi:MAG: TonB-dependent receptor [Candidatus Krumholzibacteriota bacterium]
MRLAFILMILAAPAAFAETAAIDTTVTDLGDMVVSGQADEAPSPDKTKIDTPAIKVQDPGSLADLGGLIPSARVATNSRGDSHLMIRGAPERHVQIFLDDIPLNLPWDERVDLQTIPITGAGRIEGTRGMTTLLDGPGVLAGSARILPPDPHHPPRRTSAGLRFGQYGLTVADLQHQDLLGSWDVLAAAGWQDRDAWPLPGDAQSTTGEKRRENSDLSQYSLLLRGSRSVARTGRLNLLATGWSAEKGVPPELHLGDDARFWRYPVRKRGLMGASLDLPLGREGLWDLKAALSADFFEQEIDPRGPDGWDQPLEAGQDYEKNWDRTGYGKVQLDRWVGESAQVTAQAVARYTHHRESLLVGGPVEAYAQWLTSLVVQGEVQPSDRWVLQAGLGWDHAATPESGDKAANDSDNAPAVNLRALRRLGDQSRIYAAASRRSRFPSLRELYSGALGRFVPNPGLKPEQQDLYEIGAATDHPAWGLEAAVFLNHLHDGIEKVKFDGPDKQFQRVNRSEIRVPGVELVGYWNAAGDLTVNLQHTVMSARVEEDGAFDRPAEDRPDYLSRLGLNWSRTTGPGALVEAVVTGPRWSADSSGASAATGDLKRLPAGVTWNLRLSWRIDGSRNRTEAHLRLDNLFDQLVAYQVGLPGPGRVLSGGVSVDF